MHRLKAVPRSAWIVLGTLLLAALAYAARGNALFSPGPLREAGEGATTLAGVRGHGELANRCSACHVPFYRTGTMEARCLECHTDVQTQITGKQPLHGRLADGGNCRACHTEHLGAHAVITDFTDFDHAATAFPLSEGHAGVDCVRCHAGHGERRYRGASTSCLSCHAEPQVHLGKFGTDCASCHSTQTWKGATLSREFHPFPLNHGKRREPSACITCHQDPDTYSTYTCYGCHEHRPEKVAREHRRLTPEELAGCAKCHPTGREHEERRGRERGSSRRERDDDDDDERDDGAWIIPPGHPVALALPDRADESPRRRRPEILVWLNSP